MEPTAAIVIVADTGATDDDPLMALEVAVLDEDDEALVVVLLEHAPSIRHAARIPGIAIR